MKVLVTGATGFVGRALCKRLIADEMRVFGTVRSDHASTGLPACVVPVRIATSDTFTELSDILTGVETLVHLAGRVHVLNDTVSDPLAEFRCANVATTVNVAQQAALFGVRRLVYLSSVKVNGEGRQEPYSQKDFPKPEDPYGVSKHEAEMALRKISAETGLEVVIIRPPLVYGPGVKANFLRMLQTVCRGFPLPLGSIRNRRSLIYLGNLVDAIATCMTHPDAAGQTYLVSDGEDVSTPVLIRKLATAMGRPARLFPFPPAFLRMAGRISGRSAMVERLLGSLQVDCSKIRRDLNWSPPFTMEQGLRETVTWYENQKSGHRT